MTVKFTILGCGSSLGVPRPDGSFGNCNKNQIKNHRSRCSALISTKNTNTLIDTSPDLRFQLISNKIKNIDRVFYTHMHADQTHGINDLRVFYLINKKKIPIYADKLTSKFLKNSFAFCFNNNDDGYPPTLELRNLFKKHIFFDEQTKLKIRPVSIKHGNINCMSYIINDVCGYASDISSINKKNLIYFKNLKYFIVDCLRFEPHPSHYNLNQVIELIDIIQPKKTILTNLSSEMDYDTLNNLLPKKILPAYDGMKILF
tara:strand:+ start:1522 stop:2298 length:777 start_codon:yes stop_codon:yes gene_type:complete